jgi:C-terminal processing protease CtpA/Prc
LFLPEKGAVVVTVEYRDRKPEVWHGRGNNVYTDFPMAVLINGQSASAAEIVSACLRDYKRAVVIGERSFGKGSVQNIQDFVATGGQIKMTTARYLPPSGRNIDRLSTEGKLDDIWGVMPDKGMEIKLSRSEMLTLAEMLRDREIIRPKGAKAEAPKPFEDKQLEAALNYIKARIAGN